MVFALWMRVKAIEEIVENDIRCSINIRGVFNSQAPASILFSFKTSAIDLIIDSYCSLWRSTNLYSRELESSFQFSYSRASHRSS